jgi:hypothetical protein
VANRVAGRGRLGQFVADRDRPSARQLTSNLPAAQLCQDVPRALRHHGASLRAAGAAPRTWVASPRLSGSNACNIGADLRHVARDPRSRVTPPRASTASLGARAEADRAQLAARCASAAPLCNRAALPCDRAGAPAILGEVSVTRHASLVAWRSTLAFRQTLHAIGHRLCVFRHAHQAIRSTQLVPRIAFHAYRRERLVIWRMRLVPGPPRHGTEDAPSFVCTRVLQVAMPAAARLQTLAPPRMDVAGLSCARLVRTFVIAARACAYVMNERGESKTMRIECVLEPRKGS